MRSRQTANSETDPAMEAKLPANFYNRNFERMDFKLAKALREGVMSTANSFGFCSTCDSSNVSFEVGKVSGLLFDNFAIEHLTHRCHPSFTPSPTYVTDHYSFRMRRTGLLSTIWASTASTRNLQKSEESFITSPRTRRTSMPPTSASVTKSPASSTRIAN